MEPNGPELTRLAGLVLWLRGWGSLGNKTDPDTPEGMTPHILNDFVVVVGPTPEGPWHMIQSVEDPEDDYRSSQKELNIYPLGNSLPVTMTEWPEAVEVVTAMRPSTSDVHYVLEFFSVYTGAVLAEMGTGNANDYYPYWVGAANPPALLVHIQERDKVLNAQKGKPPQ